MEPEIDDDLALFGLCEGLVHPIVGIDHLLAMASVGIVSAILGRGAIWIMPAAFVMAMAAGGIAGLNAVELPRTETLIAISLVTLGLGIAAAQVVSASGKSLPVWLFALAVVFFGVAHGNAHGLEVPRAASPTMFAVGFLVSTSALHIAGVGLGLLSSKRPWLATGVSIAGCFTAALGVGLLARE